MAAKEPREPSQEIAETAPGNGEIEAPRMAIQFRDWLIRQAEENSEDRAFQVAANQLELILGAESFDEIMEADMGGTFETRDLVDMEIEIHDQDIQIVKSSEQFNSALEVYVQFTATALIDFPKEHIIAGSDLLISSGAPLIIGKVRTLKARGFLPAKVRIVGISAPNGTVLKLAKVPNRVVTPAQG